MARIHRLDTTIPVEIDGITFNIAPLSLEDKTEIGVLAAAGKDYFLQAAVLTVKCSLKSVDNLYEDDDETTPYQLAFEEGGKRLSNTCVSELMNMAQSPKIITVCTALFAGVPTKQFTDAKGKQLEGVKLVNLPSAKKNPKK